ncbi:MAG TPA: hypothetical protein VNA68_01230 [Candidatus Dormibacteraeota bacterium]|nr:hypothetical protein [Candidatus Dormibacteraeota bacterium]
MKFGRKWQRGDTLIEVVFSVALLSVVLVAGFNVANASFRLGLQARERTEAVNLAQQQAERLIAYRDNRQKLISESTNLFNQNEGTNPPRFPDTAYTINSNLVIENGAKTKDGLYSYNITSVKTDLKPGLLNNPDAMRSTIIVRWNSLIGDVVNEVKLNVNLTDVRGYNLINCDVKGTSVCLGL